MVPIFFTKKTILICSIIFCSYTTLYANFSTKKIEEYPYTFTYIAKYGSLGSIDGYKIFTVLIKKTGINAVNLATGKEFTHKEIPFINILLKAIKKISHKYYITYDINGFPSYIISKPSKMIGNGLNIEIISYQKVDNSYQLDSNQLRLHYFEICYQKWLSLKKDLYSFNYQDNLIKNTYIDGLEVHVKYNKIYSLKDIYHFKSVDISKKKHVLTIKELFTLTKSILVNKKNIKSTIFYNREYGYPYYIKIQAKQKKRREIFSSFLKLKDL